MSRSAHAAALARLGVGEDLDLLALVDSSLDCIKFVERDGTLSFVNDGGMCALEISDFDTIDGMRWSDLWPAEAQDLIEGAVDRAMGGEAVRLEAFCPTALGRPRWWDVTVSPMVADGRVQRLLSISRDITDRVRREQRSAERERLAIVELERAKKKLGEVAPDSATLLARVGSESDRSSAPEALTDRREALRLDALARIGVMDTAASPQLDRLTAMAARILDVPTVLVSLVDADRQWFKSHLGTDLCETARSDSFCSIAIQTPDRALVIEDATLDPRTRDTALVTGSPFVRAYAGVPLVTSDGHAIGAFCALDVIPRTFGADQLTTLHTLAVAAMAEIEREKLTRQTERQEIINAELKHRMGNTYAQVSSLVGLLAGSSRDKADFAAALRENISALSRTQARIAQGGWVSLDLCALVEETVRASQPESRIDCRIDPNFDIDPQAAFMLTLALQELATNSRKHGILRDGDRRVQLHIKTTDERLVLEWEENSDGIAHHHRIPLAKTPSSGFGQKLLGRIVPMGMGGSSVMEVFEDGMRYRLELPKDRVAA